MEMLALEQPYREGITQWNEQTQFEYNIGGCQLLLFVANLRPKEIEAIRFSEAHFALSVYDEIIFFHFKMKKYNAGFDWSECPYTIHLVHAENQRLPDKNLPSHWGLLCTVILIEATTGIVKGLRALTFTHKFSMRLIDEIYKQYHKPFDKNIYDAKLAHVYNRYTSKQLLKRSIAKCYAGQKD